MPKKDLHPELLHDFDFEVHDKGKLGGVGKPIDKHVVHHLSDPEPS